MTTHFVDLWIVNMLYGMMNFLHQIGREAMEVWFEKKSYEFEMIKLYFFTYSKCCRNDRTQGKYSLRYQNKDKKDKKRTHLNDNILRTFGALGMFIKREVAKNEIRLRASKFEGIYIALSLTVSNKWKRLICHKKWADTFVKFVWCVFVRLLQRCNV